MLQFCSILNFAQFFPATSSLQPTRRTLATVTAEASNNAEASDAAVARRYKLPALGVNPAYDEALKVIAADRAARLERLKAVELELARAVKGKF